MFDKNQFYIIRAENAGVFMAKIESIEGNTAVCNSLRRLYYWEGALDVTQIAANGISASGSKLSVQMSEKDRSVIFNVTEFHAASEKSVQSINAVKEWNS